MTVIGRRHRLASLLCFIAVIFAACAAQAAPIVSESFDYSPAGTFPANADGGTGFTAAWIPTFTPLLASTGLTHPLVFNASGLAFTSPANTTGSIKRVVNTAAFGSDLAPQNSATFGADKASGDLWISYLHQLNNSYSYLAFGSFFVGTTSDNTSRYRVTIGTHTGGYYQLTANTVNLVIIHIHFFPDSPDQFTLWVNPASLTNLTTANAVDDFSIAITAFNLFQLANIASTGTATFDEFRMGTSLAEVIPEPACLALLVTMLCVLPPTRRPAAISPDRGNTT
ncbi:MAG: hypothetical protein WC058_05870 [Phycisphaeraceae bacterium]